MASDITKWADHALILSKHSHDLLVALYAAKKTLENEVQPISDILFKGGSSEFLVSYRGVAVVPESPARPSMQRMTIFIDPAVAAIQKQVLKKFPDVGDLGKMNQYPEVSGIFLSLLKGVTKVLVLAGSLPPLKKVIIYLYNRAYSTLNGEASAPGWSTMLQFLRTYERPINALQNILEPISLKIGSIVTGLEGRLNDRVTAPSTSLKRSGMWLTAPALYGVRPVNSTYDSCQDTFESIVIGYLTSPENSQVADMFKRAMEWGYLVNIVRDEVRRFVVLTQVLSIQGEVDLILKEEPKLTKLKTIKQDILPIFNSCFVLHSDRRDYLMNELHQQIGLIHSRRSKPKFFELVDIIVSSKDEIIWYFNHFDRDAYGAIKQGKKDTRYIDTRVIELIWLFKYVWNHLASSKDGFLEALSLEIGLLYPKLNQQVQLLISDGELSNPELEIAKTFGQSFSSRPIEDDYKDIRMNWLRFQMFSGLNQKANMSRYTPVAKLFEEFYRISEWIDDFDKKLLEVATLRSLFFKQSSLFELAKEILEGSETSHRYVVSIGMIAADFSDNTSELWPYEETNISVHTMCFATEFFSVLGQVAANLANDVALQTIAYESSHTTDGQIVPTADSKKKAVKKLERPRPGKESSLKDDDPSIARLEHDKLQLQSLMQLCSCGGIPILEVEFQPFEFFLDNLCSKFRNFLNSGIYQLDVTIPKESLGSIPQDDTMSFDIKRPSVFLSEIKSYLQALHFLNRITGNNVVGILRDVWIEQTDLEKAKRFASNLPNEMVFHISNKSQREKGKPSQWNPIQPFLLTMVQWYSEFLGSKALSDTTSLSTLHQSFCNRDLTTVQGECFTDLVETNAIFQLIGLQGMQFFDEKLTRMVAVLTGNLKQITQDNSGTLDKMRASGDELMIKDLAKKIGVSSAPNDRSETIRGGGEKHRTFHDKFSDIPAMISQLKNTLSLSSPETKAVALLSNQIGIHDPSDGMLSWALTAIISQDKNTATWKHLPILFAIGIWHLAGDRGSKYNVQLDGNSHWLLTGPPALENNAQLIFSVFEKLLHSIYGLLGLSSSYEESVEDFFQYVSTLLLSEWVTEQADVASQDSVQSLVLMLHKVARAR
ncbi:Nck-associated protein 1 [Kappamyces sp. JEL0680]|nr:Nck-associated protein 1 [Kappamyces sp. JEL0680]